MSFHTQNLALYRIMYPDSMLVTDLSICVANIWASYYKLYTCSISDCYQQNCGYCSSYNSAFGGNISSYDGRPSSKSGGAGWGTDVSKCLDVPVVVYNEGLAIARAVCWWADLDEGSIWVNLQKEHGIQLYIPFKQTQAFRTNPKPPMLHNINPRSISSDLS